MEKLVPRQEFFKLFKEVVLDVWREKQADSKFQISIVEKELEELKEREQQLIDAFIYQKVIEKKVFEEQHSKLKEETVLTEMKLNDLKFQELDVEAVLEFSQYVILNAPRLWVEASLDQKQCLQRTLFPKGVYFSEGKFGTAKTCLVFHDLQENKAELADLASPTVSAESWKDLNSFKIHVFCSAA